MAFDAAPKSDLSSNSRLSPTWYARMAGGNLSSLDTARRGNKGSPDEGRGGCLQVNSGVGSISNVCVAVVFGVGFGFGIGNALLLRRTDGGMFDVPLKLEAAHRCCA